MLTVDYDRLGLRANDVMLDLGCGSGRHSFEGLRRAAQVVSFDLDAAALKKTANMFSALRGEGAVPRAANASCVRGDALRLPFRDGAFDCAVVSEVLEHIEDDRAVIAEVARVVRPGGRVAVTVPRYWPERVCWLLSDEYHANEGGHLRIYRGSQLRNRLRASGFALVDGHHAHALHSPYWWLRCATGMSEEARLPSLYHRFLVWDLMKRPAITRAMETALNPVLGKSVVLYLRRESAR